MRSSLRSASFLVITLSALFSFLSHSALAAEGDLAWAKRAGGTDGPSADQGKAISVHTDGTSTVTGFFTDKSTFGPGELNQTTLTAEGNTDIFVAKYQAAYGAGTAASSLILLLGND